MDYKICAKEIYEAIGKKENLISAAHCATRLRLVIADNEKVDVTKLEAIDGVKGVFNASGQLQIIIGTGTVNKVYDESLPLQESRQPQKKTLNRLPVQKHPFSNV